jgi:hypothetical protein
MLKVLYFYKPTVGYCQPEHVIKSVIINMEVL